MTNQAYKMQLSLVGLENASNEQKALLEAAKKENKMIPNMYKAMANSPALLNTYMHGYILFREKGLFSPQEQEVVFLTISAENNCTYCMGAHSLLADLISKVPPDVTEAIRNNTDIPDKKLKQLSIFTSTLVNKRGYPTEVDVNTFLEAGYNENHILSIILAISVKTISNYTNHIFHTELDTVFKAREWKGYKVARNIVGFFRK